MPALPWDLARFYPLDPLAAGIDRIPFFTRWRVQARGSTRPLLRGVRTQNVTSRTVILSRAWKLHHTRQSVFDFHVVTR